MILSVPSFDGFPSLGGQVCDFIEAYLVHGPGDLRGVPVVLDDEKRGLIWRMYEVFPPDHPRAGRRRFSRAALSLRKGSAKTELAALIAAVELHKDGPVRCDGFDAYGNPVGRPVTDPYIPMVAYTEEQSDELAYGALKAILEESEIAEDFDIGIQRILRAGGDGKAVSLSSSPSARDGARTTFQVCDETHRWDTIRLKAAHKTMLANTPKRPKAQPWTLEVTTAPEPGKNSVAEDTYTYATHVESGQIKDSTLFFFHRQADIKHDLSTAEGLRKAIVEASGPIAEWSDIDGIAAQWADPQANQFYLRRVWLNQMVQDSAAAFDLAAFSALGVDGLTIPHGAKVALGFDGSKWNDATAIVITDIETKHQEVVGLWENVKNEEGFEIDTQEVRDKISYIFETYDVVRAYFDPPYWDGLVAEVMGKYGKEFVFEWWTNRRKPMAYAIKAYSTAMIAGEFSHNNDPNYKRHIGNAIKKDISYLDEETGEHLYIIQKDGARSPRKIDIVVAAILSYEAARDHIAANGVDDTRSAYEDGGVMVV